MTLQFNLDTRRDAFGLTVDLNEAGALIPLVVFDAPDALRQPARLSLVSLEAGASLGPMALTVPENQGKLIGGAALKISLADPSGAAAPSFRPNPSATHSPSSHASRRNPPSLSLGLSRHPRRSQPRCEHDPQPADRV